MDVLPHSQFTFIIHNRSLDSRLFVLCAHSTYVCVCGLWLVAEAECRLPLLLCSSMQYTLSRLPASSKQFISYQFIWTRAFERRACSCVHCVCSAAQVWIALQLLALHTYTHIVQQSSRLDRPLRLFEGSAECTTLVMRKAYGHRQP